VCARYLLDLVEVELLEAFGVSAFPSYRRRWNIAPSQGAPVVIDPGSGREGVELSWGFGAAWGGGQPLINARGETAREKPAFRGAFAARRCLVPATGFYEWTGAAGEKKPHLIRPAGGGVMAFAGLYEDGAFTVVTCAANAAMRALHDRMPVILPAAAQDAWLRTDDLDEAAALLKPALEGAIEHYPVSRRVNSPANDDASLTARVEPEQGGLFG